MTILRRSLIIGAAVSWTPHPTHARVRLGGGGQGPGIHTVTYGTPFKYNSGYSAKYGNGDVWATTWADNDELYTATDDFSGWQAVAPTSNMACNKLSSYATDGTMTGTTINSMTQFGAQLTTGSDGASYKAMGLVCIGGILYMSAARQNYDGWTSGTLPYKQTSANLQIIKSSDHGANWIPLPPATAQPYATPTFSGTVNSICWPIQYGKNYTGTTGIDNADQYLYALSNNGFWNNGDALYLGRVSLANLPNLVGADWSYYQGGGDGMNSAYWGSWATAAPLIANSQRVSSNGAQYLPAFKTYVHIQWWFPFIVNSTAKDTSVTQWDFYQAPHPWGPWTLLSSKLWNSTPGKGLYNPNIVPKSVVADGGVTTMLTAAGDFGSTDYQTGDYTLTLVPMTLT